MKVVLDLTLCEGFACCVMEAPEVFDVDDATGKAMLKGTAAGESLRAKVAAAARVCPTKAITVTSS